MIRQTQRGDSCPLTVTPGGVVMTILVCPYKSSLTYLGKSHSHVSGTKQTNTFISNQGLVMADHFELMANQNSADHSGLPQFAGHNPDSKPVMRHGKSFFSHIFKDCNFNTLLLRLNGWHNLLMWSCLSFDLFQWEIFGKPFFNNHATWQHYFVVYFILLMQLQSST